MNLLDVLGFNKGFNRYGGGPSSPPFMGHV